MNRDLKTMKIMKLAQNHGTSYDSKSKLLFIITYLYTVVLLKTFLPNAREQFEISPRSCLPHVHSSKNIISHSYFHNLDLLCLEQTAQCSAVNTPPQTSNKHKLPPAIAIMWACNYASVLGPSTLLLRPQGHIGNICSISSSNAWTHYMVSHGMVYEVNNKTVLDQSVFVSPKQV